MTFSKKYVSDISLWRFLIGFYVGVCKTINMKKKQTPKYWIFALIFMILLVAFLIYFYKRPYTEEVSLFNTITFLLPNSIPDKIDFSSCFIGTKISCIYSDGLTFKLPWCNETEVYNRIKCLGTVKYGNLINNIVIFKSKEDLNYVLDLLKAENTINENVKTISCSKTGYIKYFACYGALRKNSTLIGSCEGAKYTFIGCDKSPIVIYGNGLNLIEVYNYTSTAFGYNSYYKLSSINETLNLAIDIVEEKEKTIIKDEIQKYIENPLASSITCHEICINEGFGTEICKSGSGTIVNCSVEPEQFPGLLVYSESFGPTADCRLTEETGVGWRSCCCVRLIRP